MSVRFSFALLMGFCKTKAAFTLPEPLKGRDLLSFWAKRNEGGRTLSPPRFADLLAAVLTTVIRKGVLNCS